jgi:flavodoxin
MKKIFSLLTGLLMILIIAGCGKENPKVEPILMNQHVSTKVEKKSDDKILVVYFSMPESNDPKNITEEELKSAVVIDDKVLGNTQYVAQVIQQNCSADIFRIEPENPYPMNHGEIEQIATKEKHDNALPKILNRVKNFDDYKIIFVGYPIWYGDMPRILYSFLKSYNFAGKTIVPFVTSGGSGFGNTINAIKNIHPDATVIENGISLKRDLVKSSEQDIKHWLQDLGF